MQKEISVKDLIRLEEERMKERIERQKEKRKKRTEEKNKKAKEAGLKNVNGIFSGKFKKDHTEVPLFLTLMNLPLVVITT